jgi:hypothetical protein
LEKNIYNEKSKKNSFVFCFIFLIINDLVAQRFFLKFKVIAFYTAKNDQAHISFVHEANRWFPEMARNITFLMTQPIIGTTSTLNFYRNIKLYFS